MGCVIAIVAAVVIFPVSGVATSAGAAVEALAECEAAVSALSDGLLQAMAANEGPSSDDDDKAKAVWGAVQVHLGAAEAAHKSLNIYLASLRAYPISTYIARLSEGAALVDLLCKKAPSITIVLQVRQSACISVSSA